MNVTGWLRDRKAISTYVAVLLLIMLAIIAGLLIYAYMMGYLGIGNINQTDKNSIIIQSVTVVEVNGQDQLWIYVKNTGSGSVILNPDSDSKIYINSESIPFDIVETTLKVALPESQTCTVKIVNEDLKQEWSGKTNTIKIVAEDGTIVEGSYRFSFTVRTSTQTATTLVFVNGGQTLIQGTLSNSINIQRQDSSGVPTTQGGTITVDLSTTSGGVFYSDAAGTTVINSISIASGATTSTGFYYKDSLTGSPTLTGTYTGLTPATTTFTINPSGAKLVYVAGSSQTLTSGSLSAIITIQRQDAANNPVTAGQISINLSSSAFTTGTFYSDASGTAVITSIPINDGQSTTSFYYRDSSAGNPVLTASTTGLTQATTMFVINPIGGGNTPAKLAFNNGGAQILTSGTISGPITVQRQDGGSIPTTVGGPITISLVTSSGGAFYSDAVGTTVITSIPIANGASTSESFYYKDISAGNPTLTGSYTGLTSATTIFVINPIGGGVTATKLAFNSGAAQTLTVGAVSAPITVQRQDAGSLPTTLGGTITVALSTTSGGEFYSDAAGTTVITSISIASGASTSVGFYYKDNTVGSPTLTGTSQGLSSASTTYIINLAVSPLDHFTITGYPTQVTAGQSFGGVVVTAYDASNNVLTSYTGQIYFDATGGGATLPYTSSNRYTFTSEDAGTHTFLGFSFSSSGSKTIVVTDGVKTATTGAINVVYPSGWLDYHTSMSPTSATTGSSVTFTYTITRELTYAHLGWASIQVPTGFTITGTPTVIDSNPPGGTWISSVSGNTITVRASSTSSELAINGQYATVSFTATVPTIPGTYGPFTSTVYEHFDRSGVGPGTITGSDPTVNVFTPGILDHFTITGSYPTSVTAGTSFDNLVVTAYDGGNSILTSYTGQVYFTSTDPQATLPFTSGAKYTFTSGEAGSHTFTGFALKTTGIHTLTVTDGIKSATSNTITVNPGAFASFTITGAPSSTTSGVSFGGITVSVFDAYGNIATNYGGQVQFTSTDSAVTLPGAYTFTSGDSGIHTFAGFTLRTMGSQTITVAQGLISATTPPITVTAPLHHFSIMGYPTTVTINQPFGGVVVTAYDVSNNVLTTYTGQVYFTATNLGGGSSGATLPYISSNRYTFTSGDAGIHTFSGFAFSSTGQRTITVTDGTISVTTSAITVQNTGSLHYSVSMIPQSVPTSTSTSYTYTITRQSSGSSSIHLGYFTVQIPVGFTGISVTSVTSSNPPGGTWEATVSGNTITVHAQAASGELSSSGQNVRVVFSATAPASTGVYGPLVSRVYQGYTGGGSPGILDNSDPNITVYIPGVPNVMKLNSGFNTLDTWDTGWDQGSQPPWWFAAPPAGYESTGCATSDSYAQDDGPFTSDPLDASPATIIEVTFKYKLQGTDPTSSNDFDFMVEYSGDEPVDLNPGSSNFHVLSGGDLSGAPQNNWNTATFVLYKATTPSAFTSTFRFRFETQLESTGGYEYVWVDNVIILMDN